MILLGTYKAAVLCGVGSRGSAQSALRSLPTPTYSSLPPLPFSPLACPFKANTRQSSTLSFIRKTHAHRQIDHSRTPLTFAQEVKEPFGWALTTGITAVTRLSLQTTADPSAEGQVYLVDSLENLLYPHISPLLSPQSLSSISLIQSTRSTQSTRYPA